MSDLIERINKIRLQAHLSPLGGATCDARLLFNVLDEVEEVLAKLESIENADPSEALEYLDKIISYFDNPQYELGSGYSCKNELLENYENEVNTIKQALIQANHHLGARINAKTLKQMYQLVQYSKKPMKPAVWIARIDGELVQRVIMEKEDYYKLEDKVQAQDDVLKIILEEPYQCAPTILYIQINKDNPKMLDYEHYIMSVKAPLSEEDFKTLVRYITNEKNNG